MHKPTGGKDAPLGIMGRNREWFDVIHNTDPGERNRISGSS
jgi:hypothetical protein